MLEGDLAVVGSTFLTSPSVMESDTGTATWPGLGLTWAWPAIGRARPMAGNGEGEQTLDGVHGDLWVNGWIYRLARPWLGRLWWAFQAITCGPP